jgi:hypothetical protein
MIKGKSRVVSRYDCSVSSTDKSQLNDFGSKQMSFFSPGGDGDKICGENCTRRGLRTCKVI